MNQHRHPRTRRLAITQRTHPRTRGVGYSFPGEESFGFDVEARLAKALKDGVITEYDDGRNQSPWFNGRPGPELRALRDEFRRADAERRKR